MNFTQKISHKEHEGGEEHGEDEMKSITVYNFLLDIFLFGGYI